MENEILSIAKQLTQQGKTPSVALIKAKLTQRVSMPVIIRTLQQFESMGDEQRAALEQTEKPNSDTADATGSAQQISALTERVNTLEQQLATLQSAFEQYVNSADKTS